MSDSAGMATVPWEEPTEHGAMVFQYQGRHATCPKCEALAFMLVRILGVSQWQCARCHLADPLVRAYSDAVARGRRPAFTPGSKAPDPDLTRYPTQKHVTTPEPVGSMLGRVLGAMQVTEEGQA